MTNAPNKFGVASSNDIVFLFEATVTLKVKSETLHLQHYYFLLLLSLKYFSFAHNI